MSDVPSPVVPFQRSGVERVMKRAVLYCCFTIGLLLPACPLPAQQAPASGSPASLTAAQKSDSSKQLNDKLAQLDQRVTAAQSAGDNAWMLVSAALVLLMITPALITGATAERMKFSATVLFMTLWFFYCVCAAGTHGLGQRWVSKRGGRTVPLPGFRGWNRGAYLVGRIRTGLRAVHGKADRVSEAADATAQSGAEFYRRLFVVGRMVWI